jgi:hypothetical protein
MGRFNELEDTEYTNITANAKESLVTLYNKNENITPDQRDELKVAIDKIGLKVD